MYLNNMWISTIIKLFYKFFTCNKCFFRVQSLYNKQHEWTTEERIFPAVGYNVGAFCFATKEGILETGRTKLQNVMWLCRTDVLQQ